MRRLVSLVAPALLGAALFSAFRIGLRLGRAEAYIDGYREALADLDEAPDPLPDPRGLCPGCGKGHAVPGGRGDIVDGEYVVWHDPCYWERDR